MVKLDLTLEKIQKAYYAKYFIAESFKNCCKGRGFKNLEEWQQKCKVLFSLEEIDWELKEEGINGKETLFHAKWSAGQKYSSSDVSSYASSDGEVFFLLRK
jgi:hypothetical protein